MKINDRIYWISGGPWGYLGNAYAIKHSNGYVLVDTGSPEALDVIVKNLKYWNIDENKITHVLITHATTIILDVHIIFRNVVQKL